MSAGDLTLTSSINKVVVAGFNLVTFGLDFKTSKMTVVFEEPTTGVQHIVTLADGATSCVGFDVTGSVITDGVGRSVSGEYSKILGLLTLTNAKKTAAIQALVTDGVITLSGTVG